MGSRNTIPSYFLFGEPPQRAEDDFVHIEDLDYRTRPSHWSIRPHQHATLNHLFLIQQGRGVLSVDSESLAFTAPSVLVVPSGSVHSFEYEPGSEGLVVTLSDGFLAPVLARQPKFAALFSGAGVEYCPDTVDAFGNILDKIAAELLQEQPLRDLALESCLIDLLVLLVRGREQLAARSMGQGSRAVEVMTRFRICVENHFRERMAVSDFAQQLEITEGQLRRACRTVTGRSPTQLVQERQIVEAKRGLAYSELSVQEIAASIGFDDPAYFSRFFSKMTGLSPRDFRAQRLHELNSGKRSVRSAAPTDR